MILIIGGNCQGKLQFAKSLLGVDDSMITDGGSCGFDQVFAKPLLNRLHLLIQRLRDEELDAAAFIMEGIADHPEITIVCDELGLGVVPIDPGDRQLQELTGRIQCRIAEKAAQVFRVHCSVPVLIKGSARNDRK